MINTLDLTKIKLGKRIVLTYIDFVKAGDDIYEKEWTEKCKAPPTAEFKAAIGRLNEYVYKLHPLEAKNVESLDVTEISIRNEDNGIGITLSVTAQFKDVSRPCNFNTSYVSSLDNSNPLPDSVVELVDVIKDQAKLYSEGRYDQAILDFSPNEEKQENVNEDSVGAFPDFDENNIKSRENTNGAAENPKRDRPTNKMKAAKEKAETEEQEAKA